MPQAAGGFDCFFFPSLPQKGIENAVSIVTPIIFPLIFLWAMPTSQQKEKQDFSLSFFVILSCLLLKFLLFSSFFFFLLALTSVFFLKHLLHKFFQ